MGPAWVLYGSDNDDDDNGDDDGDDDGLVLAGQNTAATLSAYVHATPFTHLNQLLEYMQTASDGWGSTHHQVFSTGTATYL